MFSLERIKAINEVKLLWMALKRIKKYNPDVCFQITTILFFQFQIKFLSIYFLG
jgi:hypothetical protein